MTNNTQESIQGERKSSLLEKVGLYLARREGRKIAKSLVEKGFFRTDSRSDDESLKSFLDYTYAENGFGSYLPEVYIAPGILFGELEKKYIIYLRTNSDRERHL